MSDKVRAALFNILGPLNGYAVLDAYAGSGALGFEALSHGAQTVVAVEIGRAAIKAINSNIETLNVSFQYRLETQKVETWLAKNPEAKFDLIFAMPPYALLDKELIQRIGGLLSPEGILVVEFNRQTDPFALDGLRLVDTRSYGDPKLAFYKPA